MLDMQKPPKNKHGIGYTDDIASTSNTKPKKLDPKNAEMPSVEPALPVPSAREPASSNEQNWLSAAKQENAKNLRDNIVKKNDSVLVRLKVKLEPDEWIKDSGCSRHMTGNKDLLSSYKTMDGAPRTPQSNGVVERKNRTLKEMTRTMLNEQSIPQKFWCNAVDTATYILNRILIRPFFGKTPYELSKEKKPSLEYFKVFGSKCFILNTKDYLTEFDPKSTKGIFLGYSPNSKAYVVLNRETMRVEESLNVKFDESHPPNSPPLEDDDVLENENIERQEKDLEIKENEPLNKEIPNIKESKDHPL
ncbi:retrovirus-related pol polyprotein from transposon TNT 1-94 [Tanacetum coccineum]|uniref:Retrovirus-related pol polyprotein from transposon TNT 1-94 n=1 Tax=Tanacetum coccineum TaxID=301880 RepID=A0ABQ5CN70_9ASTR